ncbi:polysaccharide lyase family 14 protein [Roridomyces roridus]|uniref:Polysaccharide lyase family 14 protein n=1 Tax=Roridomyces roridus TaxID=1738132 RepID=A0AAD7B5Y3_9AGAR|nr:polysaccharide lyase family 14 protein [Roridomyces roridus]
MHASRLYILLVALLTTTVVADSLHDNSAWSRRHRNRAIARAQPNARATTPEVVAPPTKLLVASATASSSKAAVSTKASVSSDASTSTEAASSSSKQAAASSTKSSTAAKSSSTESSTSSNTGGGALSLNALFPAGTPGDSWSTSPKSSSALSLSDATFQLTNLLSALTHTYMSAPDGKKAMQAIYPEGSYTFGHDPQGGFSFYAHGPSSLDMTKAKTLTLGYSVYFPEGFDFNIGGKLPGLYGGDSDEVALSCSGGRRSVNCYSARFMFRENGEGELYTYLPDPDVSGFAANKAVCGIAGSTCNPTYGASVARGSWTFATGGWTTISQRVQLNDAGQANGEIQVWANGKEVINVSGLKLRDSAAGRHRGIQMQTFFGGSTPNYASPKTQEAYFSDFSVAIIDEL